MTPVTLIKKKRALQLLQLQGFQLFSIFLGTASGNRTRDSAVRGLRLNLLTNAAYIRVTSATRISIHNISELVQYFFRLTRIFQFHQFLDFTSKSSAAALRLVVTAAFQCLFPWSSQRDQASPQSPRLLPPHPLYARSCAAPRVQRQRILQGRT